MAPRSSRVRLDLNNSEFQDGFFSLEAAELKQVGLLDPPEPQDPRDRIP